MYYLAAVAYLAVGLGTFDGSEFNGWDRTASVARAVLWPVTLLISIGDFIGGGLK